MDASDRASRRGRGRNQFLLYVEGPRDREILECWARRLDPEISRCVERSTVILGGRQPARAHKDFRKRGGVAAGLSGLIVLDRDHHENEALALPPNPSGPHRGEQDLEVFVWGLRHIESYLLVPSAIRRAVGLHRDDRRVEDFLERESRSAPSSSEPRRGSFHAKSVLGASGSLSEALGAELRAGEIARAMRKDDFHADVHALFGRISQLAGIARPGPEVVVRTRPPSNDIRGDEV